MHNYHMTQTPLIGAKVVELVKLTTAIEIMSLTRSPKL